MKKIIQILTIISIMVCGINGVRAFNQETNNLFIDATNGTCSLVSSDSNTCEYSCEISKTATSGIEAWAKFKYFVEFKNGKISSSIDSYIADGTFFPFSEKSEEMRNILKDYFNEDTIDLIDKFGMQDSEKLGSPMWDVFYVYYFTGAKITNQPSHNYFVVDGNLKCRGINPRVEPMTANDQGLLASISEVERETVTFVLSKLGFSEAEEGTYSPFSALSRIVGTNIQILRDDTPEIPDNPTVDTSACGLLGGEDSSTVKIIKKIYGYIKVIIPILIIALSIADFIKVVGTGKDDDMKKAIKKFATRIIIAIVFIVVPILISLLINISGIAVEYPTLNGGLKAIFCILG